MLSREIQPIYLYLLQLTMNLAGISYLTFSHILTTYPSPAKHNNCSKTNTIMLPPGGGSQLSAVPHHIHNRSPAHPGAPFLPSFYPCPSVHLTGQDDLIFPPNTPSHPHLDIQHIPSTQQTLNSNCDLP